MCIRDRADLGLVRKFEIGDLTMGNVVIVYADAPPFEALDPVSYTHLTLPTSDLV